MEARAWNTSAHQRRASLKEGAPTGMIMNLSLIHISTAVTFPIQIFVLDPAELGYLQTRCV